jgi:hypothetical protein
VIGLYRVRFCLFVVCWNFPQYYYSGWKLLLSADYLCTMIREKFWLSVNYRAERHAISQDHSQKVKTFRGFTVEKPAMTQNNSQITYLSAVPQKDMLFCGINRGKFWLPRIIRRKSKKLRARIFPRIRVKILNYLLTFIRGLLGVDLWKKRDQKISCYAPLRPNYKIHSLLFILVIFSVLLRNTYFCVKKTQFHSHSEISLLLKRGHHEHQNIQGFMLISDLKKHV